jgi:hypothetical protein
LFKGFSTKQDKAFKRTTNNANTPYHKATHSELLKQNKQLKKDLKLSQIEVEISLWCGLLVVSTLGYLHTPT